ncbi:MAG: T9SS type A sorting domain-containing protein [Ignavibacteria bacterium]
MKFEGGSVGIQPIGNKLPSSFALRQNYPNPFNPITNIEFDIPKSSSVRLTVYDIRGREVSVLLNEKLNAGSYRVMFDGSNLSSGIYFYRLTGKDYTKVMKMVLIK